MRGLTRLFLAPVLLLGGLCLFAPCGNAQTRKTSQDTALSPAEMLALNERIRAVARGERRRFYNLGDTAQAAVLAHKYDKATRYADELLAMAPRYKEDWNYGNAIHTGHSVRGLVALAKGDVNAARQHLRLAGKTPGSPQLDTFGPDFMLAREMLRRGERESVLEYLDLVAKFWAQESERSEARRRAAGLEERTRSYDEHAALLAQWKRDITAGKIPAARQWR